MDAVGLSVQNFSITASWPIVQFKLTIQWSPIDMLTVRMVPAHIITSSPSSTVSEVITVGCIALQNCPPPLEILSTTFFLVAVSPIAHTHLMSSSCLSDNQEIPPRIGKPLMVLF